MRKKLLQWGSGAAMVLGTCALACAQTTQTGPDYATAITGLKTDMSGLITSAGIPALGALLIFLGFGLVWRLIKRAAKSA